MSRSPWRPGFLLITLVFASLALAPTARAVDPPPDGGYPNFNTAEGENALFSLTTGADNTAIGFNALFNNTTGTSNTATGFEALFSNTTGESNTAGGDRALFSNTFGSFNTATGFDALYSNTTGSSNTAVGTNALGGNNGSNNTATGYFAMLTNRTGNSNTATGWFALFNNETGSNNTAHGVTALFNTTGNNNIALGNAAGMSLTTGSNNIDIGNHGVVGESATIRIGTRSIHAGTYIAGISGITVAGGVGVIIDNKGHLGTITSSERCKDAIEPMEKASQAIFALKPVRFRYKHELDPEGIPQFGLLAEQVEKVNPDLVVRDEQGKPYTVRYEAVNAMLLNEFLKEHRRVEDQDCRMREQEARITQIKSTVAEQAATIAQQDKEVKSLMAALKEQAAQLDKVSDQLAANKSAPRVVANDQ